MNVLDFAMKMGERGKEEFGKMAAETTIPGVRGVFTMMAMDQQEVCRRFMAMKGTVRQWREVGSPALDQEQNEVVAIFAHDPAGIIRKEFEAYRQALAIQSRIVAFMERVAGKEANEEARGLLVAVAEVERRLHRNIEGLCDFVQESRWYPSAIEYAMMFDRRPS